MKVIGLVSKIKRIKYGIVKWFLKRRAKKAWDSGKFYKIGKTDITGYKVD